LALLLCALALAKSLKALAQVQNGAPGLVITKNGGLRAHTQAAHQRQGGHGPRHGGKAWRWEQAFHR
jgi:hypothetical protein